MGLTFEVPEMIRVERAGRAMGLRVRHDVEAGVSTCIAGAAALAAMRHISNRGMKVLVHLTDDKTEQLDAFRVQLNVLRKMGVRIHEPNARAKEEPMPTVISGTDSTATHGSDSFFIAGAFVSDRHREYWDQYVLPGNPLIKTARADMALTTESVRAIDRIAIDEYGLPGICLMENAGIGATVVVQDWRSQLPEANEIVCVAGPGNNGGDAFVVARGMLEKEDGPQVRVALLCAPDSYTGDARINLDILCQHEGIVIPCPDIPTLNGLLASASMIVDGLFGTGLDRAVEGVAREWIDAINASGTPVLSLDIPSGLHPDSGEEMGCVVHAGRTVTFAAPTPGLFAGAGPARAGQIWTASIGVPVDILQRVRYAD